MDLAAVMDDIGTALETIEGLRVFPYWADRIVPPAAVVGWPDPLSYDATMTRGADEVEGIPVIVMVGKADQRSARDQVAAYANGSGARSVKAVIEAHAATAYDSARVARAEFGVISVGGVEYLAATFSVDLIGQGA
jgi:hypothetical protein